MFGTDYGEKEKVGQRKYWGSQLIIEWDNAGNKLWDHEDLQGRLSWEWQFKGPENQGSKEAAPCKDSLNQLGIPEQIQSIPEIWWEFRRRRLSVLDVHHYECHEK